MRRTFALLVLFAALPVMASSSLYSKYEAVRQGLLKGSLNDIRTSAKAFAAEARAAKKPALASQADAVAKSPSVDKAAEAFAPLSDSMIELRKTASGAKPAVYYCSMVKKSWLQPKGKIGNPYAPEMQMCGELKSE